MAKQILALHPQGKRGVNISKQKYDVMRQTILHIVQEREEITFNDLMDAVTVALAGKFEGSISWYTNTVKLDLEARGEIMRIEKTNPPVIRLAR